MMQLTLKVFALSLSLIKLTLATGCYDTDCNLQILAGSCDVEGEIEGCKCNGGEAGGREGVYKVTFTSLSPEIVFRIKDGNDLVGTGFTQMNEQETGCSEGDCYFRYTYGETFDNKCHRALEPPVAECLYDGNNCKPECVGSFDEMTGIYSFEMDFVSSCKTNGGGLSNVCLTNICSGLSAKAKCSTIAASADFCGTKVYDSSKADADCAAATCNKDTSTDVTTCCKGKAKCSTIAASADFCGTKVYDSSKADADCAAATCNKDTSADVTTCCKAKAKCSTIDASTITLCMMVKDESAVIEETLLNMLPYIDRYDITDTGSTDGTPDVIRTIMSRNNVPGTVYYTEWNGFGDHGEEVGSQTVMYSNCYGKADYLFKMDADDLVVGLLEWPEPMDMDAYDLMLRSESGKTSYLNRKLLSGSIRWRAFGPVHEYVGADVPFTSAVLEGDYHILSRRLSNRNHDNEKYERDASILEKALILEPNNARYQFYLAQSYLDAGLLNKSLSAYLKRATMKGWHEEVCYALYQAGNLKQRLNYTTHEIQEEYLRAYESHPARAEPLYELSRLFRLSGRPVIAYMYAHIGLGLRARSNFLFVDRWVYSVGILDEICATAWYANAYEEGLSACSKLPMTARIKENMGSYLDKMVDMEV